MKRENARGISACQQLPGMQGITVCRAPSCPVPTTHVPCLPVCCTVHPLKRHSHVDSRRDAAVKHQA
jgi:hypothetical protein